MSQPHDWNKTQKGRTTTTQRSSNDQKSADWTSEETEELLQAWGQSKNNKSAHRLKSDEESGVNFTTSM